MFVKLILIILVLFVHINIISAFPSAQDPFALGPSILTDEEDITPACIVTLFQNESFYPNTLSFNYSLPSSCYHEEYDRIILQVDGSVNGTVQYDRTGGIFMDQVEIIRFTTPEPPGQSITWSAQRDLSVYGSFLVQEHMVYVSCGNYVSSTYNGVIYLTATLKFYKNPIAVPKVKSADYIVNPKYEKIGVAFQPIGVYGDTITSKIQGWKRNTNKAYIDMYASGHGCEEFWYSNPPIASSYNNCAGGSSRQFIVTLDDELVVGVQTPFPVMYTGGVNPLLYRPQTGIYSFNIPPYRFDLTPFLGLLNDGNEHEIGVKVLNNTVSGVWYISPVIVAWVDHEEEQITGNITSYDFKSNGPSLNIISDNATYFDWDTEYSASLSATSQLIGTTTGKLMEPASIKSQVLLTNGNRFYRKGNTQFTDMNIQMELSSSALDSMRLIEYPYHLVSQYISNASGFAITAELQYGVRIQSSNFFSNEEEGRQLRRKRGKGKKSSKGSKETKSSKRKKPSPQPSSQPSSKLSRQPSRLPTREPSSRPTTKRPSSHPTRQPSLPETDILLYENSFKGVSVYSKFSDESAPGGLVVIEEGLTNQTFSIIHSKDTPLIVLYTSGSTARPKGLNMGIPAPPSGNIDNPLLSVWLDHPIFRDKEGREVTLVQGSVLFPLFKLSRSTEMAQDANYDTCFSQYVQSIDGYISKPPDLFMGDCIPKTFCSEFDACAFPSSVVMEAPLPDSGSGDDVLPFRLPPSLKNCTEGVTCENEIDSLFE